jgi:diaminohydroxyphosphoribosylaminopyrimidine deaminase/5-amino-6-(5-phosphoribosylamino)uracil reductase
VVMSRTLDLPTEAALWETSAAPTIVMTQRGARRQFQQRLRDRGVEIVEFDFLTPDAVSSYCYDRGFLRCLWECGGTLAAPAIAGGAIQKVMAFIAPKLVRSLLGLGRLADAMLIWEVRTPSSNDLRSRFRLAERAPPRQWAT